MKVGKIELENPFQLADEIHTLLRDPWLTLDTSQEYLNRLYKCKTDFWALKRLKKELKDEINFLKTNYGHQSVQTKT